MLLATLVARYIYAFNIGPIFVAVCILLVLRLVWLGLTSHIYRYGMIALFAARNYGLRDVVLTGNLSRVTQAEPIFSTLNRMFDMNFIIPENSAFGPVMGAALAGIGDEG